MSRSMEIRLEVWPVHRLVVGDFRARFGLGVAFGNRGKLLDFAQSLDAESFLVPDQGGYNGALLEWGTGRLEAEHLVSAIRDHHHRLVTSGSIVRLAGGDWLPYATFGATQLANRGPGDALTVPVTGFGLRRRYRAGSVEFEMVTQPGRGSGARAVVFEGRHRQDGVLLRYTGWAYGNDFFELTSGGKAAPISQRDTIETCEFSYAARRTGQEGLVVEATTHLSGPVSLSHRLLLAQFDRFRRLTEYAGGLQWSGPCGLLVAADYRGKWDTDADTGAEPVVRHKCRLHVRMKIGEIALRSYIAAHAQTESPGWMSLHADMKINLGSQSELWLWSRFDQLHHDRVGYWYGFAQAKQRFSKHLSGVIKVAHVYSATSTRPHETTVSFEVRAAL